MKPVKVSSPESSQLALRRIANWENGNGETDLHRLHAQSAKLERRKQTEFSTLMDKGPGMLLEQAEDFSRNA